MKPLNEFIAGILGTGASAVGTVTQTNEVLQTISFIVTILGGVVTLIVLPILNWYRKAKADGKITVDEINEGVETLQEGLDGVKNIVDENKNKKEGE